MKGMTQHHSKIVGRDIPVPPAPTGHRPRKAIDSGDDVPPPEVRVAGVACKGTDAAAIPRVAGVAGPAPENHMQPESDTHTKLETLNRDDVRAVVQSAKIAPSKGQLFY